MPHLISLRKRRRIVGGLHEDRHMKQLFIYFAIFTMLIVMSFSPGATTVARADCCTHGRT